MWPSPREAIEWGDIEAAIIDMLLNSNRILEMVPTDNISTDLIGFNMQDRWILISREGGPSKFPVDYPRIDVNTYAERRSVAYEIMRRTRAVLMSSSGYRGHGLFISATQEEVGPVRSADKENATDRYFCSIRFTTRASVEDDES